MKHLIKQYLDQGISRRELLGRLGTLGMSAVAANRLADALQADPLAAQQDAAATTRTMKGTGGALLVAQLKAAGVDHIFFNPSSGHAPILDALVDEPGLHLIEALHEGACVAMADGYAKASGKVGVVVIAHIGLPNAMTQMVNSFKDQIPVVVIVDGAGTETQAYDHSETIVGPLTKWYWSADSAAQIPDVTRRAIKFALTPPCGPVFLSMNA